LIRYYINVKKKYGIREICASDSAPDAREALRINYTTYRAGQLLSKNFAIYAESYGKRQRSHAATQRKTKPPAEP
jgi:hypothetical protein